MSARRCSMCAADWPDNTNYKKCPECEGKTDRVGNIDPMPKAEARSRKNHAEFERFYEKWDAEHPAERLRPPEMPALAATSERPSPE